MFRTSVFIFWAILIGCTEAEEPTEAPEDPPALECIESMYCCAYTCSTQAMIDERGPDPCDCDGEPEEPEGECTAVEGECQFVI